MSKLLKILKIAVALPLVLPPTIAMLLTMAFAARLARTDRKRAAWLLLRLATLARRMPDGKGDDKGERKRKLTATFILPALLLQGAPWKRVGEWCEQPGHAQMAFEFYFAEQRFDQALAAARFWCEQTEAAIVGREAEMRAFFARHGDDLSMRKRGEIIVAAQNAELAAWEAEPHGKRPKNLALYYRVGPQITPFFRYYDAHLARCATRWITQRALNSKPTRAEFARQRESLNYLGLPRFQVNDQSLRALGMNVAKLIAVRRQAQEIVEISGPTTG